MRCKQEASPGLGCLLIGWRPGASALPTVVVHGQRLLANQPLIDATGRGSKLPSWLERIGARLPDEVSAHGGFTYYTRYFQGEKLPAFPPEG